LMVNEAPAPGGTFCGGVGEVRLKSAATGAAPVPVIVAVCGEPATLSATEIEAVKFATDAGVNVTEIEQAEDAARFVPQAEVSAKSVGLAPVMVMPLMFSVALPGFESVRVCDVAVEPTVVLGKLRLAGERTACGAVGAVPVPISVTVSGDPVALSTTLITALKLVADAGVKVTEIVQVPEAASVLTQVFAEIAKSDGLAPVILMLLMVSVALPGSESTVVIEVDVLPTAVLEKERVVGVSTACGSGTAVPVPVRVAVCSDPVALSATFTVAAKVVADTGVKFTEMLQLAPTARVDAQPLVRPKSAALAPPSVTLVMLSVAVPEFDRTITCALLVVLMVWLPNATVVGVRTACGVPAIPVPVRVTVCGLEPSLSVRMRVPVWMPVAEGVKVTLTVQEDEAASEVPQLSLSPNCVLAARLVKVMAVVPVLVRVTACDVLVVVNTWFPNISVDGLTVRYVGDDKEIL